MLTKSKFWQWAAAFLLLLNLVQLFFRPPRHDNDALKNKVVERLRMDAAQVAAYEELIEQHRSDIREQEQEMLDARGRFYALLIANDVSAADSLARHIGTLQTEVEMIHFSHFRAIRQLCREDQMADFQKIIEEVVRILSPPQRHSKPPR